MSDNADRSGPFNGGTEFGRLSCKDPAPHWETASISTQSDDFSEFFDFPAYYGSDGATDVTTQSDAPSEKKRAPWPSLPTPAATPAANPDHDGDSPMPDAPAQEPQLPHVWPAVSGPQPPRDTNILLESSPSPQSSGEMRSEGQPQVTSTPGQKKTQKTRVIRNPDETNLVREMKACYSCKMSKKGVGGLVIRCVILHVMLTVDTSATRTRSVGPAASGLVPSSRVSEYRCRV